MFVFGIIAWFIYWFCVGGTIAGQKGVDGGSADAAVVNGAGKSKKAEATTLEVAAAETEKKKTSKGFIVLALLIGSEKEKKSKKTNSGLVLE